MRKLPTAERDERLQRGGRAARPRRAARPQAGAALRRAAAARGAGRGPSSRENAGLPDGRAAVEPRRAAAPRDAASRSARCSSGCGMTDGLRHARPGRGDDAWPTAIVLHDATAASSRTARRDELYARPATLFVGALHRHAAR
ncbi:MAG: hypothetical protein MZV65_33150 [Chromatiales bacterium]|nr:hypothetical protein [Chromatiales bacterium]